MKNIKTRLLSLMVFLQIPLILVSLAVFSSYVRSNNTNMVGNVRRSTEAQVNLLNINLTSASSTLKKLNNNSVLITYSIDADSSDWFFYTLELQNTIDILESGNYKNVPIHYFIFNTENSFLITSTSHPMDVYDKIPLKKILSNDDLCELNNWRTICLNSHPYQMYLLKQGDYIIGTFINHSDILNLCDMVSIDSNIKYIIDDSKQRLYAPGTDIKALNAINEIINFESSVSNNYTTIDEMSGKDMRIEIFPTACNFSLIAAIPRPGFGDSILGLLLPFLQLIFIVLTIPIYIFFVNKELIAPLNYALFAHSRAIAGDFSFRANTHMYTNEFNKLNSSFNVMMDEIKRYKSEYYEAEIQRHKIENRYLQTISYPHFLQNNLSLINNFTYQHNEQGIHDCVLNLSVYLRYFITANSYKHTLRNDIESARSYLNLNMLAHPNQLEYSFDYPEDLLNYHFPPLIVSSIIENCIKHALTPQGKLSIKFSLKRLSLDSKDLLMFSVYNSSAHFPEDLILSINTPTIPPDDDKMHIGLNSIKQSLFYNFREGAKLSIQNKDKGVIVYVLVYWDAFIAYQQKCTKEAEHEYLNN